MNYERLRQNILIKILISVAIILSLLSIILYFKELGSSNFAKDSTEWNHFGAYLSGTVGVCISLSTLIVTAWIANEFNNFQKRQMAIQLFKEFRTEKIRTHRSMAREVKKQWERGNEDYRVAFIESMIEENEIHYNSLKITKEQIQSVYELFAFYSMLSSYKEQKEIIGKLNYFYYAFIHV